MIKAIEEDGLDDALALVRRVFDEFEAPDYSYEGVSEFYAYINRDAVMKRMDCGELLMWGFVENHEILGVLALRGECHIALLFVDGNHHRKGIARDLLAAAFSHCKRIGACAATVNSSPYAVEAYRRLGFVETSGEKEVNGIRFTPMACTIEQG